LILRKSRGSLTKAPGEPVRLDPGRWIVITRLRAKRYADLISAIRLGSGGQGVFRTRGGGAVRRKPNSAAARRGNPPEFTNLCASGLYSSEAKVWEGLHIMCDPHVRSDRRNRARDGVRNDEGGHAQWSTPAWMRSRCAGLGSECKGVHERVWC